MGSEQYVVAERDGRNRPTHVTAHSDEVYMLVFGHIGLTLGIARALSRDIDARWVVVASLLPDLIDKPLQYVIAPAFTHGNTRTVGHSLTVLLVCMVLVAFPLQRIIRTARVVVLI